MTILIVEDEPVAADRLKRMLAELAPEAEVKGPLDSIDTAVAYLRENAQPDLIFMDIHLADGSSFEIFELVEVRAKVVFLSAYDQYALEAFKLHALHYLLKPLKRAELQETLNRFHELQPAEQHQGIWPDAQKGLSGQAKSQARRFLIKIGQHIRVVDIAEAAYFFTADKITYIVTQENKKYPIDISLDTLEVSLPTDTFFRVNRQFIVHIRSIKEMYTYSKSRVRLDLQPASATEVIVSVERSPEFKTWLTGMLPDGG